ncbi:hypothetical protein F4808DRAFT_439607 [Astrocystis sublimbata]|nr:hypothetical protein F4808DRAFT_439607 [Astrocystis sublimbata]
MRFEFASALFLLMSPALAYQKCPTKINTCCQYITSGNTCSPSKSNLSSKIMIRVQLQQAAQASQRVLIGFHCCLTIDTLYP